MGSGFGTLCGRKKSETPAPERSDPRIGHASDRMWSDMGKSRAERIREIWPICAHDLSLWVRLRRQIGRPRACSAKCSEMSDKRETGWWSRRDLNPRPLGCERSALPAELLPHRRNGFMTPGHI